jgi:hypothetical protein
MTQFNDTFLVSVANAVIRDPNTLAGLVYGKALLTSAFTMTLQKTEVRGGINNPLRYVYMHDKALEVKIEQVTFTEALLALNAGNLVSTGVVTVLGSDCVNLTAGVGTVVNTPTGNVTVFLSNGTIQTVTPSGKTITVAGGGSDVVQATYEYTTTADRLSIETTKPPSIVDLTLLAEVRDNSNNQTSQLQIHIPKFQVSGNFNLSLSANGVSNEALDGFALASTGATCELGDTYGTFTWVPVSASAIDYSYIAATPGVISFSAAGGNQTAQITILGIRGGVYTNTNITTSCLYTKNGGGSAHLAIGGSTGLVTMTSGSNGDTANMTAMYITSTGGSLTDVVPVTVTA